MNTRPIAAAEVASRAARAGPVILPDGRMALASRHMLTPPYRAARGPIPIVAAPSAARMAMCKPALAAAMPATIGRLAAANQAIVSGLSMARWSADLIQAHHNVASVTTAAVRTSPSGTLHGRRVAALIRRTTDSPRTIKTNSWKRSARCQALSGTRRLGESMPSPPTVSAARPAVQKAYRSGPPTASVGSQSAPPRPKQIR
jgi:hypothetical protein